MNREPSGCEAPLKISFTSLQKLRPGETTRTGRPGEWLTVTEDGECRVLYDLPRPEEGKLAEADNLRISDALREVMNLEIAKPFIIDVAAHPELDNSDTGYPMDLSLINDRLHNHFYRSPLEIENDLMDIMNPDMTCYMYSNAATFNMQMGMVVRNAKVIGLTLLEIIHDPSTSAEDVIGIYHQKLDNLEWSARREMEEGSKRLPASDNSDHRQHPKPSSSKQTSQPPTEGGSNLTRDKPSSSSSADSNATKTKAIVKAEAEIKELKDKLARMAELKKTVDTDYQILKHRNGELESKIQPLKKDNERLIHEKSKMELNTIQPLKRENERLSQEKRKMELTLENTRRELNESEVRVREADARLRMAESTSAEAQRRERKLRQTMWRVLELLDDEESEVEEKRPRPSEQMRIPDTPEDDF